MKYIFKYALGGILYLFVQTIIFLWYFDTTHFKNFSTFLESLKDCGTSDDYDGYG